MSITPHVIPPIKGDPNASQTINLALQPLYQDGHTHATLTSPPRATDGVVGDISIVLTGAVYYLYVKTVDGWYKSTLTKA
jgi:hypothetical protein